MMATKAKQTAAEVVVEPENSLVLTQVQPGLSIEGNFAALKAYVDQCVADYVDVVVTPEYVGQAKHDRAALNALVKDIDARRLAVKREYTAPVTAFEERIKTILAPAKDASAAIDAQIKRIEEDERIAKRAELVKHWEEFAGALADAVSFEQIEDPKWALKSANLMAAFEAIEERALKVAADYESLDDMNLSHLSDARTEFLATLDLSAAIARSKTLEEQEARAAQLEADRQAFQAQKEAAHEPVAPVVAAAEQITAEAAPVEPEGVIELLDWTFTFHCTREKAEAIAAYAKSIGVHGKAVRS